VEVTGTDITSKVTKEATEEEEGIRTYTATIAADKIDFVTENDPPFTGTATEAIPKLSHVHEIVKVPAVEATCETDGNTEYFKCKGCNKYFEDAEGTKEITDKSTVVIPAKGHAWGEWTFDLETKTHSRVCANDPAHKETEACTFTHQPSSDPDTELYTCTVCGGQYEQLNIPVITTDKTEYLTGEDILVTTELNGNDGATTGGWIALYDKNDTSYSTSMLWYYPAYFENPKLLQSVLTPSDTNLENLGTLKGDQIPPGEYQLVFAVGTYPGPYDIVGQPAYFKVSKRIKSEEVTKEPTCTETGIKHIIYEDDTTEDVDIPALGHDPKEAWVHDAEKRTHYHECSRCDAHIDEAACTFDEGKVTKEATATEEGEMLYTCTVCGGTYTEVIPTLANQGVKRVYGDTRFQTALLQANELKEFLGLEKFPSIIVATGANYADALSGAYLGYVKGAPILLVQNSKSDVIADVNAYIKDNIAPGGTVYLLGGEAVVTEDVTKGLDVTTKRLSGATRYETNIEILKEAKVDKESILVCDGSNYADSLSASAAKLPILLVKGGLNDTQRDYLNTLPGNDYYLVGGTGVLPVALENELKSDFGAVERLGGADRYETSTKVAEKFFEKPEKAVVAYAMNYPDGLCGGTLAAYMNAPLLLVRDDKVAITEKYSKAAGIKSGVVLGGSTLVSDKSVRTIFEMEEADEIYVVNKMVPMTE
jgi:putative cell wall-binding protein